ncbi:hypothetical protein J2T58_001296 [Methanocalculus alkaliphilus]|uniref:hypothetical protein n=1 Tax=Methanocalculus alkaliphilus TaxID=768730 RepID=UPI0020A016D6|nr:hypothetical protein [Methanocalculus alkaliphilus]MCP1715431.1 hypothetical protein [Methanocalculus alkaliphilus]
MPLEAPKAGTDSDDYGFTSIASAHTGRTMMLNELSRILDSTSWDCPAEEIKRLIVEENILKKTSISSRKKSYYHVEILYSLDIQNPLFAALRFFWDEAPDERPLIALEAALFRDHILRYSAQKILPLECDTPITKEEMIGFIEQEYGKRYSPKLIDSTSRNLLSSWVQSGHLRGRIRKIRRRAQAGPASLTYAIYLGQLTGLQGASLFDTVYVDALDATDTEIQAYLHAAMKKGWLIYRSAGGIIELTLTFDQRRDDT